ncbi:MAG: EAL domain-containing protein [Burkholderiales bacterium]|nr:EAL domain-containing protein [Burkholderiales bacterium]
MRSEPLTPFARALRKAVWAFVLVSTLAAIAYGLYSWKREQQEVKDNLTILSGFLASASQSFFDDLGNGLEPLGQLLDQIGVLKNPEIARADLLQFQIRHPDVGAMALFAPSGEMLINTAIDAGQPLPNFIKDPPYFKQLMADMQSAERYSVPRPEYGKALRQWRIAFRYVVRDKKGKPRFLLQAAIPLEREGTFLHRLPLPPSSYIGLLRGDGYQQARWPAQDPTIIYGKLSQGPAAQMIAENPGIKTGVFGGISPWSVQDGQRIGAFTKLQSSNMYAYISAPAAYVAQQWWRHNAPILLSFLFCLALFSAGAYRVSRREQSHSQELLHQARRDALTGLPNRAAINEIVRDTISFASDHAREFAVLFIDLDRFKDINDAYGHVVGDHLIVAAANTIHSTLRDVDVLGRFGGDEFTILLRDSNVDRAIAITERLLNAFQTPLEVGARHLQISPSVGIAIYPAHGTDIETLIKHADTAMYEAKRKGGGAYSVYAEEQGARVHQRLQVEHQLRDALKRDELTLVYQPIVNMLTGQVVGAEALLRWQPRDGKQRLPEKFIGIAEASGLIIPIGEWVLHTACAQAKAWNAAGRDLWMAVNLSAHQFQDPQLVAKVSKVLRETRLDASRLELEITESAAMRDPEMSIRIMGSLKSKGVRIAIDDFGTGYSSLSYLKRIPADKIKIDKSFVDGVNIDVDDTAIVRTILALVHGLEKTALAEGIETEAQFHTLRGMGCQHAQGYWISHPIDAQSFSALLDERGLQIVKVPPLPDVSSIVKRVR